MPDEEGLVLAEAAARLARQSAEGRLPPRGVEIGAWCGRSTLFLASGLVRGGGAAVLLSVDHHHGSEECQAGWEHHEPDLVDARTGRIDTLSRWRDAIDDAGAGDVVIGVIGDSPLVAAHFTSPLGLVFIDGGHGSEPAWADYHAWVPLLATGGLLAIHDVFPDPRDGGRPPFELYSRALSCGSFTEEPSVGSLRLLRRVADGE